MLSMEEKQILRRRKSKTRCNFLLHSKNLLVCPKDDSFIFKIQNFFLFQKASCYKSFRFKIIKEISRGCNKNKLGKIMAHPPKVNVCSAG